MNPLFRKYRRTLIPVLCGLSICAGTVSLTATAGAAESAAAASTGTQTAATAASTTDSANTTSTQTASLQQDAWAALAAKAPSSTTLTPKQGKWIKSGSKWKFKKKNGTFVTSSFYKVENAWYYFDKKGYVKTGWITVNKNKYYASKTRAANGVYGEIASGWTVIGKYTYYFSTSSKKGKHGVMATGWKKIKKKIFYFTDKGRMKTGVKKVGKNTYYFKSTGDPGVKGSISTGWQTIGSKTYYFRKKGKFGVIGSKVTSQWLTIDKKKYYFNKSGLVSSTSTTNKAFIKQLGKLANADMKKSGVLASVTVAQAILESGFGTSSLAMEANNLFGMKANLSGNNWTSAWSGKVYNKKTSEYTGGKWITITAPFRAYSSYAESVADHSAYLTQAKTSGGKLRYAGLKGCKSYKKAAQIIKNGGYATAPNYVSRLCAIIKQYNLTKYDK